MLLSNASTQKIHRYDPVNNAYLGAINTIGTTSSLVVNQTDGEVYGLTSGPGGYGISRYNIWSGAYLGTVAVTSAYGAPTAMGKGANGEVLLSCNLDIIRVNPLTGAQVGSSIYYTDRHFSYPKRAAAYGTSNYVVTGNSDGAVWGSDYTMVLSSAGFALGSYGLSGGQASSYPRDIVARGTTALGIYSTPSQSQLVYHTGTSLVSSVVDTYNTSRLPVFAEFGHGDDAYVVGTNVTAANMYVRRYGLTLFNSGPENTISFTNQVDGTAIFLAPEPGSLSALALGAFALLRRRARSR